MRGVEVEVKVKGEGKTLGKWVLGLQGMLQDEGNVVL